VAWLVVTVFSFQCAILYIASVQNVLSAFKLNIPISNLTQSIHSVEGFFDSIRLNLYLYIPLLSMGLMSREISSGSIKLLQSSPLNTTQVIGGKYLGIITFGLVMLTMVILFLIGSGCIIVNADTGLMLSGIVGIYLLICTFCAIGLLMSCLTSYQVVAAITTFTALAALTYIGFLWQHIPFFNDLAFALSMQDRSTDFLDGLISSKNVFYYLLVIFLSLSTAILYGVSFCFSDNGRYFFRLLIFPAILCILL
jgi:ABC-2 type transport system permease protein